MKTLKTGIIPPPPAPWWVGEILTCEHCGAQVELEEGDEVKQQTEKRRGGKTVVTVPDCPTCSLVITKIFHNCPGPGKNR